MTDSGFPVNNENFQDRQIMFSVQCYNMEFIQLNICPAALYFVLQICIGKKPINRDSCNSYGTLF